MAFNSHRFESYYTSSGMSGFPAHAVQVGIDQDGTGIYLGRCNHQGDVVPAKVIPEKNAAYIAWNGEELSVSNVEVLREVQYNWVHGSHGSIPSNAVVFGQTGDGEALYAGRCTYDGSITPGKVHPSHGCLYIPFGGKEIAVKEYEVLCLN